MDAAWLASATGFAVVMSATPGPNNALAAAQGARFGVWRTLPQALGVAVGMPALLLLTGLGVGELLRATPALQAALRWAGAALLLWFAWGIARAPLPEAAAPGAAAPDAARPIGFVRSALLQWVNPKAWMIAGGAILAYGATTTGLVALAAIFAVVAIGSMLAWAALGAGVGRLLRSRPLAWRAANLGMAALLVASVVPLLAG